MSLLKETIQSLAKKGKIEKEVTLHGMKIILGTLSTEEQILSESIVSHKSLREKYNADQDSFMTLQDTLLKHRSVSILCFAIKSIDEKQPVDTSKNLEEQFKERLEFRDELLELDANTIDFLLKEYNVLMDENKKVYEDLNENLGK